MSRRKIFLGTTENLRTISRKCVFVTVGAIYDRISLILGKAGRPQSAPTMCFMSTKLL